MREILVFRMGKSMTEKCAKNKAESEILQDYPYLETASAVQLAEVCQILLREVEKIVALALDQGQSIRPLDQIEL